jgi:hypothetical protein
MAKDLIDASILHLRARALEQFSIIKGIVGRPTQELDMDKLSGHVMKLAQFENAMVTLQQYRPHLAEVAEQVATQVEVEEDAVVAPVLEPAQRHDSGDPPRHVTPDQSPTLRRSQEHLKKKRAPENDDES